MRINVSAGGPGGEMTFLSVASADPPRSQVVEIAYCVVDGTRFYRQRYPAGGEKQRMCAQCIRRSQLRMAAEARDRR